MTSQVTPVTILTAATGASRRYVAGHMAERLSLQGLPCRIIQVCGGWSVADLPASALYIFHRVPYERDTARLLAQARKQQAVVIFSTDDLTFRPEVISHLGNSALKHWFRARLYAHEMTGQRQMLTEADAVIVATPFLAREVEFFQKPVWLHRTGFSEEMLLLSQAARSAVVPTSRERVVIGYACGTPSHDRDFAQIEISLKHILERFPQTELRLIGPLTLDADWLRFRQRVQRLPYVSWRRLPALLAQFDINLAPLEPGNPVCEAKSELKYVEGLVGVPTVASPTEAFRSAIRSGENGWLARTPNDWENALTCLIEQPELRLALGQKAQQQVIAEYNPTRRSNELVSVLKQIAAHFSNGSISFATSTHLQTSAVAGAFRYQEETAAALPARLAYAARNRGWRILLMQIWAYLEHRLRYGDSLGNG